MFRIWWIVSILWIPFMLAGCSDGNDGAPSVDEAHPEGWVQVHGEEAREEIADCQSCHGIDLQGRGEAISCFECHQDAVVPEEPGTDVGGDIFLAHPWRDQPGQDHGDFARQLSWTRCANAACHGPELQGGDLGPSCFLGGCHAEGPPAPHPFFVDSATHGPAAQNDQLYCRNCHGTPPNSFGGGFVGDPQILNSDLGSCFTSEVGLCHATHSPAQAHPNEWIAGHMDTAPEAIDRGCALCHDIRGAGPSPLPGAQSCTDCHPAGFE